MPKPYLLLLCSLLSIQLLAQIDPQALPQSYQPQVGQAEYLGEIPALRNLIPLSTTGMPLQEKTFDKHNYFYTNELNNPHPLPQGGDPLVKPGVSDREAGLEITPILNFEGLRDPFNVTVGDPTGDIGKNHYMQAVNTTNGSWFQIWNKQGQSVYGPALTNTIWAQVNTGSRGDPIVQYDHAAQRWLLMELRGINLNELLLAVSNTSDPTGGWKAYVVPTLGFPDYPKLYVWPNAYFITVNEISNGNKCSGYALEKSAFLSGTGQFQVYRFEMPNFQAIIFQPATGVDWEGGPPPPAGTPGYILRVYDDAWNGGADQLQMWEVNVDWANANQSSITGPISLFPSPFETKVCFSDLFSCIEQSGAGAPRITAFENSIMYKAPYRNFGDHESIVLNHVVDVSGQIGPGGDAAVRWYELRRSNGGPWSIYQEGTYAPDLSTNRFTGTISMDDVGNMAIGYTALNAGNFVYPGLRLTGRRQGDPLGTMPIEEYTLMAGGKDHIDERWGDYSSMTVDPEDDRTFWFTGQYQPADAVWGTRIAAFKIQRDTYDVTPVALLTPIPSANFTSTESVSTRVLNAGLEPASGLQVSLYLDNVLIATDNVSGSIPVGGFWDHTFTQTVALTQVAKDYRFKIISKWQYDTYAKNDTFNQTVRYLTSQDAACAGRANFPGLICGSTFNLEFVLKNAGAQALQSANIQWNINADPVQTLAWSGNLPPGASDTISLPVTGVGEGVNFFYANVFQPNGVTDQDIHNDSLFFKFFGNLDGAYVAAYSNTNYGVLDVELRRFSNNQLLVAREFPPNSATTYYMCTEDNTCYKLVLFSSTLAWEGHFILFDIFGDTLVQTMSVDTDGETFTFCTPNRKPKDVGAWALTAPQSYEGMSNAESVKMEFRNFGLNDQNNIQLSYRMNSGPWHTESYNGTVKPTETISFTFSTTEDLSAFNTDYLFEFKATVNGDEIPQNDQKTAIVSNRGNKDAAVISLGPFVACNNAEFVVLKAVIKNEGLKFLDTAQMLYTVNGLPQMTIDVPCSLAPGAAFDFLFNPQGLNPGANEILVDLTNVDGPGEDQNPLNDSMRTSVFIDPNKIQASVSVFTDDKPNETSWQLFKQNGQLLAAEGPYSEEGWLYFSPLCLDKEDCYIFRLKDAGGDGMNGFVQIEADGLVLGTFFGGNFGDSLDIPICVVDTKNIEEEQSSVLYPNPTAGMVWLNLPVEAQRNLAEAYLLDPSGKVLQVQRLHRWDDRLKGGFSLEKYPAGTYSIRVLAGKSSRMFRVVKQ